MSINSKLFEFLLLFIISLMLSDDMWKPIAISLVIFSFVYILQCNDYISFIVMGLIGYVSALLYILNYYEWGSLLLLISLCRDWKNNNNIIVGKILTLLIVFNFIILLTITL